MSNIINMLSRISMKSDSVTNSETLQSRPEYSIFPPYNNFWNYVSDDTSVLYRKFRLSSAILQTVLYD